MKISKLDQSGIVDSWLIAFVITFIIFLATAGFGFWANMGKQDYKNNVDAKISEAIKIAEAKNSDLKEKEFTEREKKPLKTYVGPAAYASVTLQYPKTWSAYIDESAKGTASLDGSVNPNFVPGLQSGNGVALRFQVINTQYAQVIKSFEAIAKSGKATISPYKAPLVPTVTGIRIDGEYLPTKKGSMVVLPVRDKTIEIWTEAPQFLGDFDNIILPNLNFIP